MASHMSKAALALLAALSAAGCRRAEEGKPASAGQTGAVESPLPASEADATPDVLPEIAAASVALTNYICQASQKARVEYRQMRERFTELPSSTAEQCVKMVVARIMSVQYEKLDMGIRSRALRLMWDIMLDIGWRGMGNMDVWELRVRRLSRLREVIEAARSEKCDGFVKKSFIAYEMDYVQSYSEFYEKQLAYRTSKEISPKDRAISVKEMPEEEYAVVKAKFEEFLGHPIRAYEEIVRIQLERARQMEMEDERRLGGPDVQVDTRGL